jgi:hypothetical protein
MKKLKNKKIKHISLKSLRNKAWALMSEWVRRSQEGQCFTCSHKADYKTMHAGHYIHKDCLNYDLININCQCPGCNTYRHGNLGTYGEKLIKTYGMVAVEDLRSRANQGHKFNIFELENIIKDLKEKLDYLNTAKTQRSEEK